MPNDLRHLILIKIGGIGACAEHLSGKINCICSVFYGSEKCFLRSRRSE